MTATEETAASGRIVTFYSYKGGSGRTMTLANVAWILASSGKRVLVVDWDLESPGLHRYFHPFLLDKDLRNSTGVIEMLTGFVTAAMRPDRADDEGWIDAQARVRNHAVSLEWHSFPGKGGVDLLPSGRQNHAYAASVGTFDWPRFYDRLQGTAFIDAMARDMRQHYDYVLVDSRTGLSDAAGVCTVLLPDVVVNCFTLSIQSIDGAVAVSESIRNQRPDRPLRFVPALMRVEDAEQVKLEIGRDHARRRFRSFLEHRNLDEANRYWGDVEIPYKPFFAYEEILATFAERPRLETSLLAAYERLAGVLTDGDVREMPAIEESERRQWLAKFERPRPSSTSDVLISYAAVDRMWAEWIQYRLLEVDMRVTLLDIDSVTGPNFATEVERGLAKAGRTLVLLSKDYVSSPQAVPLWQLLESRTAAGMPPPAPIRLDGTRIAPPFTERLPVDLAGVPQDRAHEAVLGAVGATGDSVGRSAATDVGTGPRFPGALPPIWNVPQRNAAFTGRRDTLDQLRDRLSANITVVVPQALYGLGGVGKTQVAIEYAYRFAADYDLVWWISAEQVAQVRSSLGDLWGRLAEKLNLQQEADSPESVRLVREALRHGRFSPRWLLIFDNVGEPETIREFLPQGPGHVLLTSRNQEWAPQDAEVVEIDTFTRAESVTLLTRRVAGLPAAAAEAVAARLGDLPLAIEQAAAWLSETGMPVERYLELLDTHPLRVLSENAPVGYERTTTATFQLSLDQLRKQSPAAAKLLEICAFFAPEPIPTGLLYTPGFTEPLLRYDPALHDSIRRGQLIRRIGRYALASVDTGQTVIQIHRLMQDVIRGSLTEAEREENRRHVHRVLATAERTEPDELKGWPTYARLLPHVRGSQAQHSPEGAVRLFVADVVRYLWFRGDFPSSQELAEETVAIWRADPAIGEDPITLLVDFHLGNALRSQAEYDRALAIDSRALELLKEKVEDRDDPYIVMVAGGLAADLRALGRYDEAKVLAEDTYKRAKRTFGDEHDKTLLAENNLAVSLRLVGDFAGAADLDEDQLTRRRNNSSFGKEHPHTLLAANNFAHDLRALGRFAMSRQVLDDILPIYRRAFGDSSAPTLRAAKNLAVTLRKLGEVHAAQQLTADTLQRYRELHGEDHPDTLSCLMNAAFEESAQYRNEEAERIARQVLAGYERLAHLFDERHPFRVAALNNLAIFVRINGRLAEARELSEQASRLFEEALGPRHPYTLSSRINLANVVFDEDDLLGARNIDENVWDGLKEVLGADNPDTLAAAWNLVVSRRATGDEASGDQLFATTLARSAETLGPAHPNTVALQEGRRRLNCDISPPPT
ncbi:FxSxx-COOH system tetratricopeptide repeat protein [Dactylosporangium sp. NPDC049140]|uniref:FxSxx-COOH system tetratricopeptide repeat protein n=1 Tax=Dactylosporangium sp. NPDC049140 TaxID=3155647 RepID=UPI0033E83D9E